LLAHTLEISTRTPCAADPRTLLKLVGNEPVQRRSCRREQYDSKQDVKAA